MEVERFGKEPWKSRPLTLYGVGDYDDKITLLM